jgi:soluble lytic murein transglycosylase
MQRSVLFPMVVAAVCLYGLEPAVARAGGIEQQRRDYRAAMRAVSHHNDGTYHRLLKRLDGYILKPQLEYAYLSRRLNKTPTPVLHRFLERYPYAVVSERLRDKWLHSLARKGHWKTFMREYRDIRGDDALRCYRLNRLLRTRADKKSLTKEVREVWLSGRSQPKSCDPVFTAALRAGLIDRDLVWERIRLAMERGATGLTAYLGREYLPPRDRIWVTRWRRMHRNPDHALRHINYPVKSKVARMIVRHGILRLAYRDPEVAMKRWQALRGKYDFSDADADYVLRKLGLIAARRHLPEAVNWLSLVSPGASDDAVRQWQIRAALRVGAWSRAKRFIGLLTPEEQKDSHWRYLLARVEEQLGNAKAADKIYTGLARERSYYGFLAADRLKLPYNMQQNKVQAKSAELKKFAARPAVAMAHELFTIGEVLDARRQWAWATRDMNNRELELAAFAASRWGWHDRAILTINRSGHQDDLDLRFPVLYRQLVEANAKQTNLDPGWIYGVVRQESAFITDARSRAGALGLMQLMPRTGRRVARRLKLKVRNRYTILKVENNIRLGTTYLKTVLEQHQGNQVLATAAYNAGPYRVKQWLPDNGPMDADVWVEGIPFNETRNYVKNVLGFTTIYDYRLGNTGTRLSDRMPRVGPAKSK